MYKYGPVASQLMVNLLNLLQRLVVLTGLNTPLGLHTRTQHAHHSHYSKEKTMHPTPDATKKSETRI